MFTVSGGAGQRDCSGLARRDFLRIGTVGLTGLTLDRWLSLKALASGEAEFVNDKAVVVLFLSGGASHIETFNPNMHAPAPYHSVTGDVQTTLPGVAFGGTFPQLARHAHHMALVRSFQHPIGGHVQAIVHMLTGGTDPDGQLKAGFSMGAGFARLRGGNHPRTGMPTYALLNSEEVDPQYRNERGRVERGSHGGTFGSAFAPFRPGGNGDAVENMSLNIPDDRVADRRYLLSALDRLKQHAHSQLDGGDRYTQQAFDLILGTASKAFDPSLESPETVERYDTSRFRVGKKTFRPSQLGRHMLTARRLIEAGCGFITVHSAGWDMHADSNNPGIHAGMEMLGRPVDQALSAFLEDLEQRGLLEKVLVVVAGDFGRSPKINSRGGRDHWPRLCTLALAGGGLNMGQVIGRSGRNNDEPASEPLTPAHLHSTILHTLFDAGRLRVARGVPSELMAIVEQQAPLPGLF